MKLSVITCLTPSYNIELPVITSSIWYPFAKNVIAPWREPVKTTKMASSENLSIAGELLSVLSPYPYHSCVSNLHSNETVHLSKFNRDRLPANHWVDTKRFVTSSNRVLPNALFEIFGEYSSETGAEVRDNLVGWTYDNFREIQTATNIALSQRRIELKEWIQEMTDERTPGDEIALFILCKMYSTTRFCLHKKMVVDHITLHHAIVSRRAYQKV